MQHTSTHNQSSLLLLSLFLLQSVALYQSTHTFGRTFLSLHYFGTGSETTVGSETTTLQNIRYKEKVPAHRYQVP
jgi:hypothetical protein